MQKYNKCCTYANFGTIFCHIGRSLMFLVGISDHLCLYKVPEIPAKNDVLCTDKKSFQSLLHMLRRVRPYFRREPACGRAEVTTKIASEGTTNICCSHKAANVLSALVKRLSRTEECPVDILRGKCGARVRDFDVEHIELLIAQVAGRAEIQQNVAHIHISSTSEVTTNICFIIHRSAINRAAILGCYWVIIG